MSAMMIESWLMLMVGAGEFVDAGELVDADG
jgi:hypothetical protein